MSLAEAGRIAQRFKALSAEGRAGLVNFIMAGDPDMASFEIILAGLPNAGADIIEIGMPFSDPMADGPAIQLAGLRALRAGTKLAMILAAVARFRERDRATPIVLMGYYNPVFRYGAKRFSEEAAKAGVDGLILVDLPPEEAGEFLPMAKHAGIDLIRLTTPTTDKERLPHVLRGASGFIYHVAIAGITGTRSASANDVAHAIAHIRAATDLPLAVGFGVRTPEQAAELARIADAVVVGSALVENVRSNLDDDGRPKAGLAESIHSQVTSLAASVRTARSRVSA